MELPICYFPDVPIHASVLFSGLEIAVLECTAHSFHCVLFSLIFSPLLMIYMRVVFVGLGHSGICVLFNVCCLTVL